MRPSHLKRSDIENPNTPGSFFVLYRQMQSLAPPEAVDHQNLRDFFFSKAPHLPDIDTTLWKDTYQHDLVGLSPNNHRKRDRLTPWITRQLQEWKTNRYFKAFIPVCEDHFLSFPGKPTPQHHPTTQKIFRLRVGTKSRTLALFLTWMKW